jgi:two-component system chemotaxis response regulator CheV
MASNTDKNGILLETGTNEIEIMQFTINGLLYGINVAKVKEIIMSDTVKPVPHVHPAVEGIFKPRDILITVVDLPYCVTGETFEKHEKDLFIITHFNNLHVAFRVHTVVGISRISWKDIQKPDKTASGGKEGVATGIAQCDANLVTILDFEKIVEAFLKAGTEFGYVEQDNCNGEDPFLCLKKSYDYLTSLGLK